MGKYYMKLGKEEVEVPEWASWVAQDKDGWWFFYVDRPALWLAAGEWEGAFTFVDAVESDPPKNWKEECYQIERK